MSQSSHPSTTGESITTSASTELKNDALNDQDKSTNNEQSPKDAIANTEQNAEIAPNTTNDTVSVPRNVLVQAPRRNRPGTKGEVHIYLYSYRW
jgi:hypothetical protein